MPVTGRLQACWLNSTQFNSTQLKSTQLNSTQRLRLFCWALEWALSRWRLRVRTARIELEDGGGPLFDLRFAVLATSSQQAACLLDELVVALANLGFILNEDKTGLLTTQTQPPKTITTPRGVSVAVVDRDGCDKWLGFSDAFCLGSRREVTNRIFNIICRLHRGRSLQTDIFFATTTCPYGNSCIFFIDVTPVACFAAGHRKISKTNLDTMDVHFRRLLRSVVGPLSQTNWLNPWHEILHDGNARVCSGGWRFDVVATELTKILAFALVQCWFTWRPMGITNFGLQTPEYWKTWSAIAVVAFRRRNLLPLKRFRWLENSYYE